MCHPGAESEAATDDDDDNSITIIAGVGAAVALLVFAGIGYVIWKRRAGNTTNTDAVYGESQQSQYGDQSQYGVSTASEYGKSQQQSEYGGSMTSRQSDVSRNSQGSYMSTA